MPRSVGLPPDEPATADGSRTAGWWHDAEEGGGKIVCDLCPRACHIAPGKRGFCFVRENVDGRLVSATYGRSMGFCIDPIEKKPLSHFFPGTAVLSFGTAGCNLGCKFCQNWTSSRSRRVDAGCETAQPEAIAEAARQHGCRSVAFTYNDPIVFAEYAIDTARACHARGVKTVAVTNGYVSASARGPFFEEIDAANVDLKAFREDFYHRLTGGHLQPVLETLEWLVRESEVWLEITNLVVPGENDSPDELRELCDWIAERLGADVPVHFSAFHPDFEMTDRPRTPASTLAAAYDAARQAGLHYAYTGNVSDRRRQSTYCPSCGALLIERDGYQLGRYALVHAKCADCGTAIAGRFDERPGEWGGRRQPVRIAAFAQPRPTPSSTKGDDTMAAERPPEPKPDRTTPDRPELSAEQESLIFQAASRRVVAAVRSLPSERLDEVLSDVGAKPVLGAFVSLKRGGQLRSCCGFLGQSMPLHVALEHASVRAAKEDPRFPPISSTELDHLDVEVWILWGLEKMAARGPDRARAVTIGKHGLQIMRGHARGLLLPGVAVEHKLDAEGFLEAVCRKAGLPTDAWLDDETTLMTFEGYAIGGRLEDQGPSDAATVPAGGPAPAELATLAGFCRQNLIALAYGAMPSVYAPGGYDGDVCGAALSVHLPGGQDRVDCSRVSLRADVPLQSGLFDLVKAAARSLAAGRVPLESIQGASIGLSVLWDSAMHGTVAEPDLAGVDPRRRGVMVIDRGRWAVAYDPERSVDDLLAEAIEKARLGGAGGAAVCSLEVASTEPRVLASNVRPPQPGPMVRPPAASSPSYPTSGFYPSNGSQLGEVLDELLPKEPQREPWTGAMVPHAGWQYSGPLAADVLSRLEIPSRVIVLAPKHRPQGADWAVAPHQTWHLPGADLESDPELAQRLAESIGGLELDAAGHQAEHAIEVALPFLARLAPRSRVLGIVLHGGDLAALERFADELAAVLKELPERPLLLLSSDMSHERGRRDNRAYVEEMDRVAIDAMKTLDPAQLYETVVGKGITMCGFRAAVLGMATLHRLDALHRVVEVGHATSADAPGGRPDYVVGYAGMLFG